MNEGLINISSSDYLAYSFSSFAQIQVKNLFSDVTLVSEDNKQFPAHKLILCAGSEYFRDILSDKAHPHPMLCLDGVTSEVLERVIKYLYVGEVSVPKSSLQKFLQVSNKFKCYGLHDKDSYNFTEPQPHGENNQSDVLQETLEFEQKTSLEVQTNETEKLNYAQSPIKSDFNNPKPGLIMDETTEVIEKIEMKKIKIGYGNPKFKSKHAPESCRIEGKTFTHDQLEQILKQLYYCNENGLYYCKHCEYRTKIRWSVMVHTQKHLNNFEVDCDRCEKIFKSYDSLRAHNKGSCSERDNKIRYSCDGCGKIYSSADSYRLHKKKYCRESNFNKVL